MGNRYHMDMTMEDYMTISRKPKSRPQASEGEIAALIDKGGSPGGRVAQAPPHSAHRKVKSQDARSPAEVTR